MSTIYKIKHNRIIPALLKFKNFVAKLCVAFAILGSGIVMAKATSKTATNDKSSLFHLLLGEIAGKRDLDKTALGSYLQAAEQSRDPELARIATEFAIENQYLELARQSSKLWAELDLKSFRANLVAATLHIAIDDKATKEYLIKALELNSKNFYSEITETYQMLSKASQTKLSNILLEFTAIYPNNEYLLLGTAYIVAQHDLIKTAEELTDKALKLNASFTEAIELKAKIIRFKTKSDTQAIDYLAKNVKKYPKDARLKFFYASALLDNNQINQAIINLVDVSDDKELGSRSSITLGRIYLDKEQYSSARKYFKKLEKYPEFWSSGKYFLAQISEREKKINDAIEWYKKVYDGPFHIASYIRASLLLTLDEKYEEAIYVLDNAQATNLAAHKKIVLTKIEVLIEASKYEQALNDANRALEIIPNDIDLLYARSLIAGYLDNITLAEQDLSKILSLNPDHANALNALGFTLSHIPNRRDDAKEYLERAIKIAPNNPNYLDSMGWLLYQMGKYDEALLTLEKAYSLSPDIDITIHYSQALWTKGQKDKAIKVLNQALKLDPKNKAIIEALNNFKTEIKTTPKQ